MGRPTRIGPRGGSGKPPAPGGAAAGRGHRPSRSAHRDQAEPLGRGRIGGPVAGGGPQPVQQGGRVAPPPPDLDQAAHDRAHHLVAEGIGLDLEAQEAPLADGGGSATSVHVATIWPGVTRRMIGSSGLVPGLRRQKERKSWVPSRTSEAAPMARRSSGSRTCQTMRVQEGVGRRRVPDQVAVACGPWPSGGRRTRRTPRWPRARRSTGRAGG